MWHIAIKTVVSAALLVGVSELSKRSTHWGALLASLPLTSLLALGWLYVDTRDTAKVADLANGIFWLVLPSLVLFLVFPALLRASVGFWLALGVSCGATILSYSSQVWLLRMLGVRF